MFKNMDNGIMRFRCVTGTEGGEVPKCNNVICVPTDTVDFMIQCPVCKQYTNILKGLKVLQVSITILFTYQPNKMLLINFIQLVHGKIKLLAAQETE